MVKQLFPISSSTDWFSDPKTAQCPKSIASWLYDQHSLTEKLEKQCHTFHVQIKQEVTTTPGNPTLSNLFPNEQNIHAREVFLCCDSLPVVFAQTEIPLSTLNSAEAQLATVGSQSLGKILFQDPSMRRGAIEVAKFSEIPQLKALCSSLNQEYNHSLWARRSLFYLNNQPLLVSELFLPASGIYSL